MEPESDGFLDDGPPDIEWNLREKLRREQMAFRKDGNNHPTSTSSLAIPQDVRSPRTRIGMMVQVYALCASGCGREGV
eukprot:5140784-Amphidinium_carterae.1